MIQLRPGDVVAVFDATVRPPKTKRLLCVAVADGWFLRINTKPIFRPHHPVAASDNPDCLDHDSFVELRGVLDWDMAALAEMLDRREAAILGRIGAVTAKTLADAVRLAPTLTQAEVTVIAAALDAIATGA